jgi:peptidase E
VTDIPDVETSSGNSRDKLSKELAENLLIFVDGGRTRSLWYWVKREGSKSYIRDHLYIKGQPEIYFSVN